MIFEEPLLTGRLIRRYKRFLADVILDDGRRVTVHAANSGSMLGCAVPGMRVAVSPQDRPERKLKWTWELVEVADAWVAIHTGRSNGIVAEAIEAGRIGPLRGYPSLRREVAYGRGGRSRVDLLITGHSQRPDCYVEVKNVTLRIDEGRARWARFPDAVTVRGAKHLEDLRDVVRAGGRAVIFFLVNRPDCSRLGPAAHIDPHYALLLREVMGQGVEALAYRTRPSLSGIEVDRPLPIMLE